MHTRTGTPGQTGRAITAPKAQMGNGTEWGTQWQCWITVRGSLHFLAVCSLTSCRICWPNKHRDPSGEEEALPQLLSHPFTHPALQSRTPQGAAASSAPTLGMDGITVYGITSQTPSSQLPAGWFPCRSCWQQRAGRFWAAAELSSSLARSCSNAPSHSLLGCTPRCITEAEPGCCQLGSSCRAGGGELRKACPSWFPLQCQAKPVASHQLHPQSNPLLPSRWSYLLSKCSSDRHTSSPCAFRCLHKFTSDLKKKKKKGKKD